MKKLFTLLVFITQFSFSQELTKQLSTFKTLNINSSITVELFIGKENKIEFLGELKDKISAVQEGEKLTLSLPLKQKFKSNAKAKLYIIKPFTYLRVANGAQVICKEYIETKFIDIQAKTNAKVDLFVKTDDIKVKQELGAEVTLKGKTDTQTVKISGRSFYNCLDLISNKAFVSANSGSKAGVYVEKFLDAKAKLKASITYDGNVYSINEKTSFKGEVIKLKK